MPLPIIDEDSVLDSVSTTNNEARTLGHSTIYGAHSDDNTSIFSHSTNSTMSNLVGPGRVVGNVISLAGKRFERTVGDLAHKAGFGPEAIFQQISALYREDWKTDGKKASMLQKLCFRLFKQTKSIADSTRFKAIMRWGDLLRDHHEFYVWLFLKQQTQTINQANDILRIIEAIRSTNDSLTNSEDDVLTRTSLLIDCHSVGLNVINLNRARLLIEGGKFQVDWTAVPDIHREEIGKWDLYFQYLLESLSDSTISKLSRWYIDFWSSQIVQGHMHLHIALQSCRTLKCVLEAVDPHQIDQWNILAVLSNKVYEYFVGASDSHLLLLAQGDDFMPCDGVPVHISAILNDLVRSYNRVFSSGLDIVPDVTCISMLGSTGTISADNKEKIRGFLKDLQSSDRCKDKAFTKMMLLRSCYKLLRRALSELDDTDCFNKLSNATSFTDGISRCAILQLGDILQLLPEVYMLLVLFGGDQIRVHLLALRESLIAPTPATSLIFERLRSLIVCHATGLSLVSNFIWVVHNVSDGKVKQFIEQTAPYNDTHDFHKARERFVPFLMDNVTFNPSIFYLKCWVSPNQPVHSDHYWGLSLLSCDILQGAFVTEGSMPSENWGAIKELCRAMHNSVIEQLPTSKAFKAGADSVVYAINYVMHSVRTDCYVSTYALV